jgi:NitT/TauT family transport system substrate-binding protein
MKRATVLALAVLGLGVALVGCGSKETARDGDKGVDNRAAPAFTLAWSEYPSWSVFGVASELGLIDGRKGHMGALEKKWGVDVVLELLEYDPCIQLYASGKCDAVCVTNIDILAPAATRKSVAVMPTSTSVGADACLVVFDVSDKKKALEELKKVKVFGLAKSVSEYAFDRNLELLGEDPRKYQFTDEPPNTAALAMQSKKPDHKAIMVWNPFVLQVLKDNKDARRLFDSSTIPEEIIDMVVVGEDSLKKDKGKEFAYCVLDVYYEMNKRLRDPDQKKADQVLIKLGEKFSKLGLEDMKVCVQETRFYKTPDEGLKLFTGAKLPDTMKTVSRFCLAKEMVKTQPRYAFGPEKGGDEVQLRFDPSWMEKVRDQKQ